MADTLAKEARDQGAHFLIAAAIVATGDPSTILGGAFLGFALGAVREATEGGNVTSKGSLLDLAFWSMGGALGGWFSL